MVIRSTPYWPRDLASHTDIPDRNYVAVRGILKAYEVQLGTRAWGVLIKGEGKSLAGLRDVRVLRRGP